MRLTVVVFVLLVVFSLSLMGGKSTNKQSQIKELNVIQMQQEIVKMWNTWYEDQDTWTKNYLKEKKKYWPTLAKELAKSIKRYQYIPVQVYNWKNKTTTLPIGKDVHLMVGMMAIFETKVRNEMVGALGEIGILQCHPKWCLVRNQELNNLPIKYRKEYAKKNPHLNLDAAVQHLTVSYGICKKKVRHLNDWAFTVAHYGAGTLAIENGKCTKRKFAKARVYKMKKYRKKIRNNN